MVSGDWLNCKWMRVVGCEAIDFQTIAYVVDIQYLECHRERSGMERVTTSHFITSKNSVFGTDNATSGSYEIASNSTYH